MINKETSAHASKLPNFLLHVKLRCSFEQAPSLRSGPSSKSWIPFLQFQLPQPMSTNSPFSVNMQLQYLSPVSHMLWHCWHRSAASGAGIQRRPFTLTQWKYLSIASKVNCTSLSISLDNSSGSSTKTLRPTTKYKHPNIDVASGHFCRGALSVDHMVKPAAQGRHIIALATKLWPISQP